MFIASSHEKEAETPFISFGGSVSTFQRMQALATISRLGKALPAIHRAPIPGFKGDFSLLAASSAHCRVHLARRSVIAMATLLPCRSTLWTATRFILQSASFEKFLLASSKGELDATILTH
jgi:hypothetical protein